MEFKEFTLKLLKEYAKVVDDNLKVIKKAIEDDKAETIFSDTFTKEVKKECKAHSRLMNAVSVLARQNNIMDNANIEEDKESEEERNFKNGIEKCKSFKELIDFLFDLDKEEE